MKIRAQCFIIASKSIFNSTKLNIEKNLIKIFKIPSSGWRQCSILYTSWHYKKRLDKQKVLTNLLSTWAQNIDQKIENRSPMMKMFIIIASKSTFVISFILKITSKKSFGELSESSSVVVVMAKYVHLTALLWQGRNERKTLYKPSIKQGSKFTKHYQIRSTAYNHFITAQLPNL